MKREVADLFDSVQDGVLFLTADATVGYGNRAGRALFGVAVGERMPSELICLKVEAVEEGFLKLPVDIDLEEVDFRALGMNATATKDNLHVRLLNGMQPNTYVLVAQNVTGMKVYENAVNNLSEMVKVELLEPFNAMTDVLNELDAVVSVLLQKEEQEAGLSYGHFDAITPEPSTEFRPVQHLQSEIKRLKTVGSGFVERAGQLALLAKTYSDAAMTANHRIDVMEMVKAALDRSEPILKARQIKVSYVGMSDELPTLYGSSEWLARALSEYVNFVADHAEPDSRFLFTVRGNGNYVLLALKNTGFSLPPAMMHRAFMPFCQGVGGAEAGQGLGLGLAVSKRIIELHGGQMRIKEDVEGSMDLLIELPAGELRRAKPQDGIEQAQRYAEDLARLVQQRTSGAAMSHIH